MPMSEQTRSRVYRFVLLLVAFVVFLFVWVNRGELRFSGKAKTQTVTITDGMLVERQATEKFVVRLDRVNEQSGAPVTATVSEAVAPVKIPVLSPAKYKIVGSITGSGIPPAPAEVPAVAATPPAFKACGNVQKLGVGSANSVAGYPPNP